MRNATQKREREKIFPSVRNLGGISRIAYRRPLELFTVFEEEDICSERNSGVSVVFFSNVCGKKGDSLG